MIAALVDFVFHVAGATVAKILENLGENPFEGVVTSLTNFGCSRFLNGVIFIVTDVEGGAIEMAAIVGCIAIMLAQAEDVIFGACHRSDDDLTGIDALHILRIQKVAGYHRKQKLGSGYEIGNGIIKFLDVIVGVVANINQIFVFAVACCVAVFYRRYTEAFGRDHLYIVKVREAALIVRDTVDLVLSVGPVNSEISLKLMGSQQHGVYSNCLCSDGVRGGSECSLFRLLRLLCNFIQNGWKNEPDQEQNEDDTEKRVYKMLLANAI